MQIAIIGAGVSGLLSALELIQQGCSVTIFDQQHAGKAASWAGGGILSPMYPWRYPTAVNQLAQYGKALYQEYNERLFPVTKIDFQIQHTGMLIFDPEDFAIGQSYAQRHQEPMQYAELLQGQQLHHINPQISEQFQQALFFPHLSNIRNPRVLQSLIVYLKQQPQVKFVEHCAIRKLHIQNQKVTAVHTENGEKFAANQVVLATGAWSQAWAEPLDLNIPVKPVHGQMALFKTPENWLPTMCMNKVMYLIPRRDGHIVCGSSMNDFGFDNTPKADIQQNIVDAVLEMVPALAQFPLVDQWAGLRPSSPNGVPYIGQIPEVDNLWTNFGHFRNGLCMGPAAARLLRQLMLKQSTLVDPTAYSPERLLHPEMV